MTPVNDPSRADPNAPHAPHAAGPPEDDDTVDSGSHADDEAAIFHHGVILFNEHDFFEAHEVWEDIWRQVSGERKRFYQGLIQLAVTLEHIRRGNPRGVRSVWETCVPKFDNLPPVYMGIAVHELVDAVRTIVQPVLDLPAERFSPKLPRGQTLPADLSEAPTMHLQYDPFADDAPDLP